MPRGANLSEHCSFDRCNFSSWEKFCSINDTFKRIVAILVDWHISTDFFHFLSYFKKYDRTEYFSLDYRSNKYSVSTIKFLSNNNLVIILVTNSNPSAWVEFQLSCSPVLRRIVDRIIINSVASRFKYSVKNVHPVEFIQMSEANEVPLSSHIWVASTTSNSSKIFKKIGKNWKKMFMIILGLAESFKIMTRSKPTRPWRTYGLILLNYWR